MASSVPPFILHSLTPENNKENNEYTEYDQIDFLLTHPNRKLVGNSVRLCGDIEVKVGTSQLTRDKKVYLDESIGIMSIIDHCSTNCQNVGQIESYSQMPRLSAMIEDTTTDNTDMISSENVCEMRQPIKELTLMNMLGDLPDVSNNLTDPLFSENASFSFKPLFCLNATSGLNGGDTSISFKKTGAIRIVFTLNRSENVFENHETDAITYSLRNIRLEYLSVPEDNKANKTLHRVKYYLKNSVLSTQSNVSSKIPASCAGVSCSFMKTNSEALANKNSFQREVFSELESLEFLFQNNTSEYISYALEDREAILHRYIESVSETGHNRMLTRNLASNNNYGIGLSFGGQVIDLRNQSFNLNLRSNDERISTDPYSIHMFFHSFAEL